MIACMNQVSKHNSRLSSSKRDRDDFPIPFFEMIFASSESWPGEALPGRKRPKLSELPQSQTLTSLLRLVGRGGADVAVATSLARAVISDGLDAPDLKCLASCGSDGRHDSNSERDLHRWLKDMWGLNVQPYPIRLELQVAWPFLFKAFCLVVEKHSFRHAEMKLSALCSQVDFADEATEVVAWTLLPHELFDAVHRMNRAKAGSDQQSACAIRDHKGFFDVAVF